MSTAKDSRLTDFSAYYNDMMEDEADVMSSPDLSPSRGPAHSFDEDQTWGARDARPLLPRAAFFIGDLRDGLPMLNMQAAFLISAKNFTEKQVGTLFFVFGMSQFICMAPSGYFLDYSNNKINWVMFSGFMASALTVLTTLTAAPDGGNMAFMIILKILQGGVTSIMPPGFNGITLGIVGSTGFTLQVSRNRMMNHMGTALVIFIGTLISYFLYPNIGVLFIVSPLACIGFYYNMSKIKPRHVNREAARGLVIMSPTMTEYEHLDEDCSNSWDSTEEGQRESGDKLGALPHKKGSYVPPDLLATPVGRMSRERTSSNDSRRGKLITPPKIDTAAPPTADEGPNRNDTSSKGSNSTRGFGSRPSFNFGWGLKESSSEQSTHNDAPAPKPLRAQTPLAVLLDPTLMVFTLIVFFFHLSNSSVLPLVMRSLQVKHPQAGILLSGLCIVIGQAAMAYFAKITGDLSPIYGRKPLALLALFSLTLRCLLLTVVVAAQDEVKTWTGVVMFKFLILSTQLLDSVGAGIFGTMHILVTNDISGGTGRFSLMMGITTGAMCLGGTVSGYFGQSVASDYGYPVAYAALGICSLIPFLMYFFLMPETLPEYAKPKQKKRRKRLEALLQRLSTRGPNPFGRSKNPHDAHGEPKGRTEMELV